MTPPRIRSVLSAGVGLLALALAGCGASPPVVPTTSASPTSTPTATPTAPGLVPDGTAAQNLPLFTAIAQNVWAGPEQVHGRAYVDALVAGGFAKSAMQVTEDRTTVGDPAESIQFSVLWHDGQCLIGQAGPATGTVVAVVGPSVRGGTGCLLGTTRTIDW